jgi:hypothetical protein
MKFVPASGAATKMFKFLRNFWMRYDVLKKVLTINEKQNELAIFIVGMDKFAFFETLMPR